MDFVSRFEEHQVERIRRALIAYRSKYRVGDVKLTNELLNYFSYDVTYDSTLKNVQRLRKGERITGAAFLNACVQFLEVNMITPQEEELGLAMHRFAGSFGSYERLIEALAGDYAVLVSRERRPVSQQSAPTAECVPERFAKPRPWIEGAALAVLSLSKGEGKGYWVARERYYLHESAQASAINLLQPTGACFPVTAQDFIILMRDFLFSHMYMLQRKRNGFSGMLVLPSSYGVIYSTNLLRGSISQYDVKLRRVVIPTS